MSAKRFNHKQEMAEARIVSERMLLFLTRNTRPERTGPQSFVIADHEEWGIYHYGVLIALGLTQSECLDIQCDSFIDAMQEGDARSMEILARAAEDVRRAREDGISSKAKHVVALLEGKLEFEKMLGELPPKRLVVEFARRLFRERHGIEAADPKDGKTWDDYMNAAGLSYLPTRLNKIHKQLMS